MSQRDLDVPKSDPFVKKIFGESVAEGVRVDPFFDTSLFSQPLEQIADIDRLKRLPMVLFRDPTKNWRITNAIHPDLLPLEDPEVEVHLSLCIQTHDPHFVSLTNHTERSFLLVVVAGTNAQDFFDAKPTAVKHDDKHFVTKTRHTLVAVVCKSHYLVLRKRVRVEGASLGGSFVS